MSYALTKGQTSPRSDVGFKTKTTPTGNIETPIAALELALASGATFVAQGFSAQLPQLVDLIVAAVRHEGFSFVNVFSPCVTFNHTNTYEWFREHLSDVKDIAGYDPHDKGAASTAYYGKRRYADRAAVRKRPHFLRTGQRPCRFQHY